MMRNIFGIIMILIYLGMGILFCCGFFDMIFGSITWIKWICGPLLIIYGLWRGYRQFKGIDDNTSGSAA